MPCSPRHSWEDNIYIYDTVALPELTSYILLPVEIWALIIWSEE